MPACTQCHYPVVMIALPPLSMPSLPPQHGRNASRSVANSLVEREFILNSPVGPCLPHKLRTILEVSLRGGDGCSLEEGGMQHHASHRAGDQACTRCIIKLQRVCTCIIKLHHQAAVCVCSNGLWSLQDIALMQP